MQMIGRKRFSDNEEKINLYVAERSFKELKAYYEKNIIRKLNVMLEAARAIQTNRIDFFIEKYFNTSDFKNLISLKKQKLYVNNLAYAKLNNLYIFYQNILNKASARKYNNISYIVYNHYFKTYENMNGIIYNRRLQVVPLNHSLLKYFIQENTNKTLSKDEFEKFRQKVHSYVKDSPVLKTLPIYKMSYKKINEWFKENNFNFQIVTSYDKFRNIVYTINSTKNNTCTTRKFIPQ